MEEIIYNICMYILNVMRGFLELFRLVAPFIILLGTYFIIKIFYRYKKYGYKEFSFFKKHNSINYKQEMLFFMLDKMNGYRKIFTLKNLHSHIIIMDTTGLYIIYIFNYSGIVTGEVGDESFAKKTANHELMPIDNPYTAMAEDEKMIKEKLGQISVYKYIILSNGCLLTGKNDGVTQRVYFKDFFYKMDTSFKANPQVFTKDQVNNYFNLINDSVK